MNALKPSFYNYYFKHKGSQYVYNTLSTSVIELDSDTYNALKSAKIDSINKEYIEPLQELKFLVEFNADEQAEYLYFYNRTRIGTGAKMLSVTFVPSFACNLACPYCLEGQAKDPKAATKEDTERLLKFVENRIVESRIKYEVPISYINANLYGGEPMLQKKTFLQYFKGMKNIADKYGCNIHYMIVSNFTLLDDDILDLIEEYDMMVQVSIDGTKEEHDKRRIYKNGKGSYDVILNNLKKMKERHLEKNVVIRINIDSESIQSAEKILADIHEYSKDVYFGILEKFSGFNDCYGDNCIGRDRITKAARINHLTELLSDYGYTITPEFGKMSPCAICGENKFHVDPYLNLYTCELAVNQPKLSVGKIGPNGEFLANNNFYKMMNHTPAKFKKCMDCKLMPMCATGCSTKAYIRDGKDDGVIDKPFCLHTEEDLLDYLKHYVETLEE